MVKESNENNNELFVTFYIDNGATPKPSLTPPSSPVACQVCNNTAGTINNCTLSKCSVVGVSATCGSKLYCCGTDGYWGSQYGTCNVTATVAATSRPSQPQTPRPTPRPTPVCRFALFNRCWIYR